MGAKTMTTHTPGPWYLMPDGQDYYHIFSPNGPVVASMGVKSAGDACLLAAAPDMLAALKAALPKIEASDDWAIGQGLVNQIRAAIAKADLSAVALAKAEGEKS